MNDADAIRLVRECINIVRPIAEKHFGCSHAKSMLKLMDNIEASFPTRQWHWLYDDEVVISSECIRLIREGVEHAEEEASWHRTARKGKRVLAICKTLTAFLDHRPAPTVLEMLT